MTSPEQFTYPTPEQLVHIRAAWNKTQQFLCHCRPYLVGLHELFMEATYERVGVYGIAAYNVQFEHQGYTWSVIHVTNEEQHFRGLQITKEAPDRSRISILVSTPKSSIQTLRVVEFTRELEDPLAISVNTDKAYKVVARELKN